MSDDTFSGRSPINTGTFRGYDDYLDPFNIVHDAPTSDDEKTQISMLATPGAAHGGVDSIPGPDPKLAAEYGQADENARNRRIRSAGAILTGQGLMENANVYSASRSLLGG